MNWVHPKTRPPLQQGFICIHSDDGMLGDYTSWYSIAKQKHRQYSSWLTPIAIFCSAINPKSMGGAPYLTQSQVQELNRYGCEILSHGYEHGAFRWHSLTASSDAGANSITVDNGAKMFVGAEYTYTIVEGETTEIINPISRNGDILTLAAPLTNAYTTAAKIHITETAAKQQVWQRVIDYLGGVDIDCKHHVWTYHENTTEGKTWAVPMFDSARGTAAQVIIKPTDKFSRYALPSMLFNESSTQAWAGGVLNEIVSTGGLGIFYAHGDAPPMLEYLIDGAITRGIEFVTQSRAVELMEQWGVFS